MKKITLILALLCVSVMGFAIDWSGYGWVTDSGEQFKVGAESNDDMPNSVGSLQHPAWSKEKGIYMTFPSADQLTCSKAASYDGAGLIVYQSNFIGATETEVTVSWNGGSRTFVIYNASPLTLPAAKASTPAHSLSNVHPILSQYAYNTDMKVLGWSSNIQSGNVIVDSRKFFFCKFVATTSYVGLGYGTNNVSNMDYIHMDVWTENNSTVNFFLHSSGQEKAKELTLTGDSWTAVDIPLSYFDNVVLSAVDEFKFANASADGLIIFVDNVYFYNSTGVPDPEPSTIDDTNFALRTNGGSAFATDVLGENYPAKATDGNTGTLWETNWNIDLQTLVVDLGRRRIFNTIKIYWGNLWSSEFYLETSNNAVDWTEVKHVTDNTTNVANSQQIFELAATATARYVRFRGIHRGNGYGYTIKEFDVLKTGTPVLTSVDISSNKKITKVGEYATLTVVPKDQNSSAIAADLSYVVSPADLGHVTDGKYYPEKYGLATITVTAEAGGESVNNSVNIWGVSSDNLALNNALDGVGTWYSGDTPAKAVDGNDGSVWQGCTTNTTSADQASRTYDAWFTVDLKSNYDIQLITIHFEGACSDEYQLYGSTDNDSWTQIYSWEYPDPQSGNRTNNHTDLISMADLSNADNVRYLKFLSTRAASEWGMKIYELVVYGAEASSTKTVSATVNPAAAGNVTITAAGSPVTEVASGTEVTFTATPNDGYLFINWTQGGSEVSTDLEYVTTIASNTALIANFRALGNIYCNTEMTVNNHTIYVTMKRSGTNQYKLVIRSEEELDNFGGTVLYKPTNVEVQNIRDLGVLSAGNHTLTATVESDKDLYFGTPLYVKFAGVGEVTYAALANIEYEIPCNDDNVPVESISLNYDEATIEIGATKTLVVSFNPVYATDKSITWTSSNGTVASVDGGVVTANTVGTATITAETSNGKTATCAVTVEPVTEKTCWGTGTDFTYDDRIISWYYSVTRNENKTLTYYAEFSSSVAGLGNLDVVIDNDVWKHMTYNASTMSASYTTEGTYETGAVLNDFFYFEGRRQDFSYTVGSECAKPTVDVTGVSINHTSAELLVGETLTLSAEVVPANADDKVIIWENSDETVASFNTSTGEITALAEGTTTITAKSHFDEDIYATCVVTVVAGLLPTTYHGYATFTPNEGLTGFSYSITRNSDRSLTFTVVLDRNPLGFVGEVNISNSYEGMSYNGSTRTATYSTAADYAADETVINCFWWLKSDNNVDRIDFSYTVGSSNAELPQAVAVDEAKDNTTILTTYDGETVVGVLGRSFVAGNLYTLVVPFNVDAAQTAAKLPGQLTKLNNSYEKANGDLRINFVDASAIEAGVPYLYKPSANVTNPSFLGVTVDKDLNPTEPADGLAKYYGIYAPTDGVALKAISHAYVLGSDQYLYDVQDLPDNQEMLALRGYFVLSFPAASPGAPKRLAKVVFNENETETTTDIEDLQTDIECTKVIVNGQLQIIRDGKTYNAFGQLVK